jgi:hypothetical protein
MKIRNGHFTGIYRRWTDDTMVKRKTANLITKPDDKNQRHLIIA